MKRFSFFIPLVALVLLFVPVGELSAQIRIDVKTGWLEKNKLATVKQGVLTLFEELPWVSSTEFGEDYSLWLKNLRRQRGTDGTVIVMMDVEIRTPALFGSGTLLHRRRIESRYFPASLDSLSTSAEIAELVREQEATYERWHSLVGTAVSTLLPESKGMAGPVVTGVLNAINRAPKSTEMYEALLLGTQLIAGLNEMLVTEQ